MLTLWDLVCHVDYSKRLEELGYQHPTLFYYVKRKDQMGLNGEPIKHCWGIMYIHEYADNSEERGFKKDDYEIYNAYTSAELGHSLPECMPNEGDLLLWNCMTNGKREWGVEYAGSDYEHFEDVNEANARAKMLIYLLENGLIKT